MAEIVLATVNARYSHAALGLRCLMANMGGLEAATRILEFTHDHPPAEVAERILALAPRIVGLGIYIWNAEVSERIAAILKAVRPDLCLVLGGPEVSHETEGQPLAALADHVIRGPGDLAFAELCRRRLAGERPARLIDAEPPDPGAIALPYRLYTDEDIRHRLVYVEASRGCPFRCEFCLSALDERVQAFDLDRFLAEMERLHARGLRQFKFVDRTFNLDIGACTRILEFFLERLDPELFLHFELVPDRLPERLRSVIARFPPGSLQFEIGIQTFNPEVQALISRRQDDARTEDNLRWLRGHSHAHLHADLVLGLPGEDLDSIARGFDRLVALGPHDIQVGILKRLRGAPIARHSETHGMRYNPHPPYNVLATDRLDFATLQRLARFARYWDLVANSGRFPETLPLLLGESPFARFLAFSDWLYATTGQTHRIAQARLFELVGRGMTEALGVPEEETRGAIARDESRPRPTPRRRAAK